MANFAITISNSVNCFGISPSTLWGAGNMTWGVSKWGYGTNQIPLGITSVFSNSESPTDSETTTLDYRRTMSESLSPTEDMGSEYLLTGNGYYYLFAFPTRNRQSATVGSFISDAAQSTSWTSDPAGSTSWS